MFYLLLRCFKGPTPSNNTGPPGAQEGTTYIYLESSAPHVQGDTATLTSSAVTFSLCEYIIYQYLTFYYIIFG